MKPIVVAYIKKNGDYYFEKSRGVRLLIVDENAKHDHVYEWTLINKMADFIEILSSKINTIRSPLA